MLWRIKPIRPRWTEVAVPILRPAPEAAVTVFSIPDDGCCDTRNMLSDFAVNKYLHTVASGWISINIKIYIKNLITDTTNICSHITTDSIITDVS